MQPKAAHSVVSAASNPDIIWIDQVVEALTRAASASGPMPALNIGNGTGTRIVDLARRIIRATGHVAECPSRQRDRSMYPFCSDITRMRQMLAIEPADDPLAHLETLVAHSQLAATA